jgi:hypothetical protein
LVPLAKTCNYSLGTAQCISTVGNTLICPCPTFVNLENSDVLTSLDALKSQFDAWQCSQYYSCPASNCTPLAGGSCLADNYCYDNPL